MRLWTISNKQGHIVAKLEVHSSKGFHRLWNGRKWSIWMFCIPLTKYLCKKHTKKLNLNFKEDIVNDR